jgi:hypothetical protein
LGLCTLNVLPKLIGADYPLPILSAYWSAIALLVLSIVCYVRHWTAVYQGLAILGILLLTVLFMDESISFDSPGMLRIPVVITSTLGGRVVQAVGANLIPGTLLVLLLIQRRMWYGKKGASKSDPQDPPLHSV